MSKKRAVGFDTSYRFDHALCEEEAIMCMQELLKYLLFLRYQIPTVFITLVAQVNSEERFLEGSPDGSKLHSLRYRTWRKKSVFVSSFEKMLSSLKYIFQFPVTKFVVLFGSTVVSPKETIIIEFDLPVNTCSRTKLAPSLLERTAKKTCHNLMRHFVTADEFQGMASLVPTKVFLLFCVHRSSLSSFDCNIFEPKLGFKLPGRGIVHKIQVLLSNGGKCDNDLRFSHGCAFNVLKQVSTDERIEAKDHYFSETSMVNDAMPGCDTMNSTCGQSGFESSGWTTPADSLQNEMIWFQSTVPLKGFV